MHTRSARKDEGSYFAGRIARDNEDATYRVEFDDGDVLEAAPRLDIRTPPESFKDQQASASRMCVVPTA